MDAEMSFKARIIRDKQTKAASLDIQCVGKWKLYSGDTVDTIDTTHPLIDGEGSGFFPLPVSSTTRSYFELITDTQKLILSDRHLPMTGGYNFRDLGGYKTKDGRHVSWGKLFRADELSALTDADLVYLQSIPISSVIDFRAMNETKRSPDKLPPSVRFIHPLSITPGNLSSEGIQANLLKTNITIHMKQMNRLLVSEPSCIKAYQSFFNILQNSLSEPVIFHCSAGKDRTGIAAALLLFALGVDEDVIKEDYMASKTCLADKYDAFIAKYPKAEPIFTVKRTYIQAAINQMERTHGTVEEFLEKALRVNVEKLRELYLD